MDDWKTSGMIDNMKRNGHGDRQMKAADEVKVREEEEKLQEEEVGSKKKSPNRFKPIDEGTNCYYCPSSLGDCPSS